MYRLPRFMLWSVRYKYILLVLVVILVFDVVALLTGLRIDWSRFFLLAKFCHRLMRWHSHICPNLEEPTSICWMICFTVHKKNTDLEWKLEFWIIELSKKFIYKKKLMENLFKTQFITWKGIKRSFDVVWRTI
jgi:hypothetical protein